MNSTALVHSRSTLMTMNIVLEAVVAAAAQLQWIYLVNKEVVGLNPSGRWSFFLYVFSDLKNKFSLKNGWHLVAKNFHLSRRLCYVSYVKLSH